MLHPTSSAHSFQFPHILIKTSFLVVLFYIYSIMIKWT